MQPWLRMITATDALRAASRVRRVCTCKSKQSPKSRFGTLLLLYRARECPKMEEGENAKFPSPAPPPKLGENTENFAKWCFRAISIIFW